MRERKLRDDPRTLESLGNELGLSKERVRQLEAAAFAKMRKTLETQSREVHRIPRMIRRCLRRCCALGLRSRRRRGLLLRGRRTSSFWANSTTIRRITLAQAELVAEIAPRALVFEMLTPEQAASVAPGRRATRQRWKRLSAGRRAAGPTSRSITRSSPRHPRR